MLVQMLDQILNGVGHFGSNVASFPEIRNGSNGSPGIAHAGFDVDQIADALACADHAFEVIGLVGKGEALQIGDRPWREVPPGSDTYRAQGLTRDPEGSGNG